VLERWYEAWNAHDVDAISALAAEDILYEVPGAGTRMLRGRRLLALYARLAFRRVPDLGFELLEEWVSPGDRVIASYFRMAGSFEGALATGGPRPGRLQRVEVFGMDRSEVKGACLTRHQIFWDAEMVALAQRRGSPRGTRALPDTPHG
jgi:hypothetical protein